MFTELDAALFLWLTIALLTGASGAIVMMLVDWQSWYKDLKKAPLSPPNWLFGIVWPVLYALWAVASWLASKHISSSPHYWMWVLEWASAIIAILFNFSWTPVFFGTSMLQLGLVVILLTLVVTTAQCVLAFFASIVAGALLVPLVVWLCFATYLNVYVVLFNDVVVESGGAQRLSSTTGHVELSAL